VEEVLLRPKFSLGPDQVLYIMDLFRDTFELVVPSRRVNVVRADPEDNRILEAARAANAELIVSGDKHLLDLSQWHDISIVSPAIFMTDIIGQR
jgi:putative PIN family toxin of toxin-antitoxin system